MCAGVCDSCGNVIIELDMCVLFRSSCGAVVITCRECGWSLLCVESSEAIT